MMKKLFFTYVLALIAICASAVPAKPGLKRVLTLSDGTTVTALLVGDEHGHSQHPGEKQHIQKGMVG